MFLLINFKWIVIILIFTVWFFYSRYKRSKATGALIGVATAGAASLPKSRRASTLLRKRKRRSSASTPSVLIASRPCAGERTGLEAERFRTGTARSPLDGVAAWAAWTASACISTRAPPSTDLSFSKALAGMNFEACRSATTLVMADSAFCIVARAVGG